MNRAYQLASPGQAVQLLAGSYAPQLIKAGVSKASSGRVIFQPAPGAQVTVAGVEIFASNLELRNMQTAWQVRPGANGVTLRNITADGAV